MSQKLAFGDPIDWDPRAGLSTPSALNGVDAIVHLAGRSIASGRWTPQEKSRIRESRVAATATLVDQILRLDSPPRTFISASAIGIYGDCGERYVDEQSPPACDFLADIAKDWEAACDPLREVGIRVVHPRFGIVLDEQGGALAKMLPIFRMGFGGKLGQGGQYWSWIALRDCVAALRFALQNESVQGVYNFVAPTPVTNRHFTTALGKALGRPVILPVPSFALRLALGEMADALLLSSCRVLPKRLTEAGFAFQYSILEQFFQDLFGSPSHEISTE
jgi:uncharacterized protein (TIGR01777 family)